MDPALKRILENIKGVKTSLQIDNVHEILESYLTSRERDLYVTAATGIVTTIAKQFSQQMTPTTQQFVEDRCSVVKICTKHVDLIPQLIDFATSLYYIVRSLLSWKYNKEAREISFFLRKVMTLQEKSPSHKPNSLDAIKQHSYSKFWESCAIAPANVKTTPRELILLCLEAFKYLNLFETSFDRQLNKAFKFALEFTCLSKSPNILDDYYEECVRTVLFKHEHIPDVSPFNDEIISAVFSFYCEMEIRKCSSVATESVKKLILDQLNTSVTDIAKMMVNIILLSSSVDKQRCGDIALYMEIIKELYNCNKGRELSKIVLKGLSSLMNKLSRMRTAVSGSDNLKFRCTIASVLYFYLGVLEHNSSHDQLYGEQFVVAASFMLDLYSLSLKEKHDRNLLAEVTKRVQTIYNWLLCSSFRLDVHVRLSIAIYNLALIYYNPAKYEEATPLLRVSCDLLTMSQSGLDSNIGDYISKVPLASKVEVLALSLSKIGCSMEGLEEVSKVLALGLALPDEARICLVWARIIYELKMSGKSYKFKTIIQYMDDLGIIYKGDKLQLMQHELRSYKTISNMKNQDMSEECRAVIQVMKTYASAPVDMARVFIELAQNQWAAISPDISQRSAKECIGLCLKYLDLHKKKTGYHDAILEGSANFWLYLINLQNAQHASEHEVTTNLELSIIQHRAGSRPDEEADSEASADVATVYHCLSVEKEFIVMAPLDRALDLWESVITPDVHIPDAAQILEYMKNTADMYNLAYKSTQALRAWYLCSVLAKMANSESDQLCAYSGMASALLRLQMVKHATVMITLAEKLSAYQDPTKLPTQLTHSDLPSLSLRLVKCELNLHLGKVREGWEAVNLLHERVDAMKPSRRIYTFLAETKCLVARYLLLSSELRAGGTVSNSQEKDCQGKLENMQPVVLLSDALKYANSVVNTFTPSGKKPAVLEEKDGLSFLPYALRVLFDCTILLGKVYSDIGSPREARCYLKQQLYSAQRMALAQRAAAFLVALAEVDVLCEDKAECEAKLRALQTILRLKASEIVPSEIPTKSTSLKMKDLQLASPCRNDLIFDSGFNVGHIPTVESARNATVHLSEEDADERDAFIVKHPENLFSMPVNKVFEQNMGSPVFRAPACHQPTFLNHSVECICCFCSSYFLHLLSADYLLLQGNFHISQGNQVLGVSYYERGMSLSSKFHHAYMTVLNRINTYFIDKCPGSSTKTCEMPDRLVELELKECKIMCFLAQKLQMENKTKLAMVKVNSAINQMDKILPSAVFRHANILATLLYRKAALMIQIVASNEVVTPSEICFTKAWGYQRLNLTSPDFEDGLVNKMGNLDLSSPKSRKFKSPPISLSKRPTVTTPKKGATSHINKTPGKINLKRRPKVSFLPQNFDTEDPEDDAWETLSTNSSINTKAKHGSLLSQSKTTDRSSGHRTSRVAEVIGLNLDTSEDDDGFNTPPVASSTIISAPGPSRVEKGGRQGSTKSDRTGTKKIAMAVRLPSEDLETKPKSTRRTTRSTVASGSLSSLPEDMGDLSLEGDVFDMPSSPPKPVKTYSKTGKTRIKSIKSEGSASSVDSIVKTGKESASKSRRPKAFTVYESPTSHTASSARKTSKKKIRASDERENGDGPDSVRGEPENHEKVGDLSPLPYLDRDSIEETKVPTIPQLNSADITAVETVKKMSDTSPPTSATLHDISIEYTRALDSPQGDKIKHKAVAEDSPTWKPIRRIVCSRPTSQRPKDRTGTVVSITPIHDLAHPFKSSATEKAVSHLQEGKGDATLAAIVDVVQRAVSTIEHLPCGPLYSELSMMMAMCRGKSQPRDAAVYLTNAVNVAFRLSALVKTQKLLCRKSPEIEADWPKEKAILHRQVDLLSFTNPDSTLAKDKFQEILDLLPPAWTVCQLSTVPVVLQGEAKKTELVAVRLRHGEEPLLLNLTGFSSDKEMLVDPVTELQRIKQESDASLKFSDGAVWWETRRALDIRLKNLLDFIEYDWLNCWKGVVLGRPFHSSDAAKLAQSVAQAARKAEKLGININDMQTLEMIVDSTTSLSQKQLHQALSTVTSANVGAKSLKELATAIRATTIYTDIKRQPVILILDKKLHDFPWESIPILRQHAVLRMPCLQFLASHLETHRRMPQSTFVRGVDHTSAFYLLNPGGDLKNTEHRMKTYFEKFNWRGVAGREPCSAETTDILTKHQLYVYAGHGSGSKFLPGDVVQRQDCKAVALIMGCSSGKLQPSGQLEPYGIPLQYLMGGCQIMMGNLWDVTDKDIDDYLKSVLDRFIEEGEQIEYAAAASRSVCRLQYLIGSSPVIYGIPPVRCITSKNPC